MIRATGLRKRFGTHTVLDGLNLHVERGERVAVLGLNGAGKTTLIRCLLGLTGFEGQLEVAGYDVRRNGRETRRQIGYVPQRVPHFDGSLGEMVEFFTRLRGMSSEAPANQLAELGLNLQEHAEKPVRALSGGMLQKTLLALALGAKVPVLVLDEPTANLDARARREFLRTLRQIDHDTTILLASHRLSDVEAVADRLVVLHDGRIAFAGALSQLWQTIGTDTTLWLTVPPERRQAAREQLQRCHVSTVLSNGASLGVQVDRSARADMIVELRDADIPVDDFWTETPALEELMGKLLGLEDTR